jgi:hypothetical protein
MRKKREPVFSIKCGKCGTEFKPKNYYKTSCSRECGTSLAWARRLEKTPDRFWEKVRMIAPDECWVWTGAIGSDRYGKMKWRGKQWGTHRLAYTLANGEIPAGLHVCHRCDNRVCCNPAHLFLGTALDNIRDCIAKGRFIRRHSKGLKPQPTLLEMMA